MHRSLCLFFLLCATLAAQSSGIQGLVTDPTDAPVPDAAVTITNVATGVVSTVRSNERGFYSAPFLAIGTYRISVEKQGFSKLSRDNLKLDVDQTARVDFTLKLGAVAETVEVTAAAALL
ncbi:MAG: carboxypeptidase regulatory-like domain-containing protein, partial [Acidobacteriia bacterium]|nr:carboxypeptidase regulatory-like domain-containing protein [Terriglobia bacterium]